MLRHEMHAVLHADALRWPDHTDYWRFGPIVDRYTIPSVLPRATSLTGCALVGPLIINKDRV